MITLEGLRDKVGPGLPSALHERIFIAAVLNPSLKSRFMEKFSRFSRILAGLV